MPQAKPRCLTPEEMLCFDVYALHQAFGRLYKSLLDPLDLTYSQYLAMSVLWDDNPSTVGQIKSRLGLETSTLTPLIKRLEMAGLVERSRDLADERRVVVTLTPRGEALREDAKTIPACVERATGLSDCEIDELRATLHKLRLTLMDAPA